MYNMKQKNINIVTERKYQAKLLSKSSSISVSCTPELYIELENF